MRIALLLVLVGALPAAAQDDYYQRQLEQRQWDARMDAQRLENERLRQEAARRAQERIDQQNSDARWEAQQQQRAEATRQQIELQRRIAADTIGASQLLGAQYRKARAQRTSECGPLQLPDVQAFEKQFTGYFRPEGSDAYFMSSIQLGPDGEVGRLSFVAHLYQGELPTEARWPLVELDLWLKSRGTVRHFRARSGAIEFSRATQSVTRGTFVAEVKDLLLAEIAPKGYSELEGGACLFSKTFTLTASWGAKEARQK